MQQKQLAILLLGMSALIGLYFDLNWNGVFCKEEMVNPIRSLDISISGSGIGIEIEIINSTFPPELNTAVYIDRAVCIRMTKGHPTIGDDSFPATTVIKIRTKNTQSDIMDITNYWTRFEAYFYICTSPQVADFFFHRVEQIHSVSEQRVSKATLFDQRLEAERVEILSGGAVKIVTL
ncbi:uncharacterized protein LOC111059301 isoform X2 [Nilaparvata lugens]|uniref:uncharacterized protein LOC111059301 isoform X2 n=1 Tax=Nilaparvata lugens TaxID=108931 RepID=UPI00193C95E6|nr:uncharacterized protein LOC111059301 isoform X2 [Nilaparvata lugens]